MIDRLIDWWIDCEIKTAVVVNRCTVAMLTSIVVRTKYNMSAVLWEYSEQLYVSVCDNYAFTDYWTFTRILIVSLFYFLSVILCFRFRFQLQTNMATTSQLLNVLNNAFHVAPLVQWMQVPHSYNTTQIYSVGSFHATQQRYLRRHDVSVIVSYWMLLLFVQCVRYLALTIR